MTTTTQRDQAAVADVQRVMLEENFFVNEAHAAEFFETLKSPGSRERWVSNGVAEFKFFYSSTMDGWLFYNFRHLKHKSLDAVREVMPEVLYVR